MKIRAAFCFVALLLTLPILARAADKQPQTVFDPLLLPNPELNEDGRWLRFVLRCDSPKPLFLLHIERDIDRPNAEFLEILTEGNKWVALKSETISLDSGYWPVLVSGDLRSFTIGMAGFESPLRDLKLGKPVRARVCLQTYGISPSSGKFTKGPILRSNTFKISVTEPSGLKVSEDETPRGTSQTIYDPVKNPFRYPTAKLIE